MNKQINRQTSMMIIDERSMSTSSVQCKTLKTFCYLHQTMLYRHSQIFQGKLYEKESLTPKSMQVCIVLLRTMKLNSSTIDKIQKKRNKWHNLPMTHIYLTHVYQPSKNCNKFSSKKNKNANRSLSKLQNQQKSTNQFFSL